MTYTFYVVDEAAMAGKTDPDATADGIATAILERGGRWSCVEADEDMFDAAFDLLDGFVAPEGFLTTLAYRGFPHVNPGDDHDERPIGYFEASLVPHLVGAFRLLSEEIDEALSTASESTVAVVRAFLSALEEASGRGFAVAVLHD